MSGGWRPALRIARRSVRRNLGRSILVAALVAVPIAGATMVDVLLRSTSGPEVTAYQTMGRADARAEVTGYDTLPTWRPSMYPSYPDTEPTRDAAAVDLAALLPEDARIVPDSASYALRLADGDRIVRTTLDVVAVGDPLVEHRARLGTGRLPGKGEVLVTEPLAERLGILDGDSVRQGATVTVDGGATATVTGLAVKPDCLSCQAVVASPGTALEPRQQADRYSAYARYYFVDLPPGTDADQLWPGLAKQGVALVPREVYLEPERYPSEIYSTGNDLVETVAPMVLIIGLGMLEIVLLAGVAFAVGARRQVRDLGLIAASGGTPRHIRRIVLAQGLVLGLLGAIGGLVLGGLLAVLGKPLWQLMLNRLIEQWRFGWLELLIVIAVGVFAGLAAAFAPALGAGRMRPVDALAQRFRVTAGAAKVPVTGLILLTVGVATGLASGALARQRQAEYQAWTERTGEYRTGPDLALPTAGVLLAAVVAVVGFIGVTPALLSLLARVARRLPLSGRLGVRDAGRHRHRTVPAVAAIMVVVAGSVTLAVVFGSWASGDVRSLPNNVLLVQQLSSMPGEQAPRPGELEQVAGEVAAELPGGTAHRVPAVDSPDIEPELRTGIWLEPDRGQPASCHNNMGAELAVATDDLIELTTGRTPDGDMRAALRAGKVVVFDDCLAGEVRANVGERTVTLPTHRAERDEETESYYQLPGAFISAGAAEQRGWVVHSDTVVVSYSDTATDDDIGAALTAAEDGGMSGYREVPRSDEIDLVYLLLLAATTVVTVLGVGITVALSAAEGRADLATLAAIGAQPRRRRTLAGAQALVLGGMGTVLGVLLGGCFGIAAVPLTGQRLALPWSHLAITLTVVPLLAVAVAMAATRSRLPMVRRLE